MQKNSTFMQLTSLKEVQYNSFLSNFYVFIYFLLCWVFVAVQAFLQLHQARAILQLWCASVSLWWLLLLWSLGSRHMGVSSCSTQAQLHVRSQLPNQRSNPHPCIAGRFLTTRPQGKPLEQNSLNAGYSQQLPSREQSVKTLRRRVT